MKRFVPLIAVSAFCNATKTAYCETDENTGVEYEAGDAMLNWSSTHSCHPKFVYEPKTAQEVTRVLQKFQETNEKIRPIGSGLSPNGIGMCGDGGCLLSTAGLDEIQIDSKNMLVTVGAGITVDKLLKALKSQNLTLENFSSIQEQQIAGWTQVAAHGTGAGLPTVEEMIVRMQLATPNQGILTLSDNSNPWLFRMAKVGLGCLGVVTEVTLKCIPAHTLEEHTYTVNRSEIHRGHKERLKKYRHVRYMWIPYSPTVVVVVSNPVNPTTTTTATTTSTSTSTTRIDPISKSPPSPATQPMLNLARSIYPTDKKLQSASSNKLSFSQLRDILLDFDPLNVSHIKKVNIAEAEFWKLSHGVRVASSTDILGFDCGGEQHVLEVCFPVKKDNDDLQFVADLLTIIEQNNVPAPSPIEQRWTSRSTSFMSPAFSNDANALFSWVGIIMYLPPHQSTLQRNDISEAFRKYVLLMEPICSKYEAVPHWAKIELLNANSMDNFQSDKITSMQRTMLANRYPIEEFQKCRKALGTEIILSHNVVDVLFEKSANK